MKSAIVKGCCLIGMLSAIALVAIGQQQAAGVLVGASILGAAS